MTAQPCPYCGAALMESRQAAPYIGPGARLVTLRDVPASVCSHCDYLELHLIEQDALDSVIRSSVGVMADRVPTMAFSDGRWRVSARQ